ncbi:DNA-binding PadR family transcriptional regulator [Actinoplanes lutulentus]|uniref:PadR family transcriptional regulator n=1 Tax=Actinoplanes lutulentus TaxID=1287878 RepID=A0A327ZGD3_9ACTN|nr:helix-turn-helix transcriptional regulator [Actinoplanes lutulentus]MBB2948383.1 DNA-binding PadR family transcriptional regulator [Actinoplanes lutulentus]RAK34584.1 PadR family transcriptional regulator [Actinoplanes lutulentus]
MQVPTFLILAALAGEPRHGYGIVQTVVELSAGEVSLRPGTLYGALERLTEQGLIEPDHEEAVEGRLRRYYRLTTDGATTLAAEAERLQRHADAAREQLRRRPGTIPGLARLSGGLA